jgi:3-phenylpropionate/trans-cinnamate dioxygenase ferredoxin subunit
MARLGIRYPHRSILCDPKRFRAKAYPVNVDPARVVKGPHVAELSPFVESDYVVVDL